MKWVLLVASVLFAPRASIAQDAARVVGTWSLVSAWSSTDDGTKRESFGSSPSGVLTYGSDGRMMVLIANGGRKPLSADRVGAPEKERAEAFSTFLSYGGRYSLKEGKVVHHVEISSYPNWVGTDLVRTVAFEGDRITLTTPPISVGGKMQSTELVWERLK
jgi:Lipocalin-like domain